MGARIEELDWQQTSLGEISLRRRWDPLFNKEVYEVKLNDEFLMSSLFTVAEVELAHAALSQLAQADLDIMVGGLGLGYTAQTVLEYPAVRSLVVVDALAEVIDWHERTLVPVGEALTSDSRCRLVHGNFFTMVNSDTGLDSLNASRKFHAVVVDIDHSPQHFLHPSHATFYSPAGLRRLATWLHPGGVFALWSNDQPDESFEATLAEVFVDVRAHVVSFQNPLQQRDAENTIYTARTLEP